jgi:hypothetical protein
MAPASRGSAPRVLASTNTNYIYFFYLLLAFRLANALVIRTFFQPDEFYQSLEPAWQLAFGSNAGACITWVHNPPRLSVNLTPWPGYQNTNGHRNGETTCGLLCTPCFLPWCIVFRPLPQLC